MKTITILAALLAFSDPVFAKKQAAPIEKRKPASAECENLNYAVQLKSGKNSVDLETQIKEAYAQRAKGGANSLYRAWARVVAEFQRDGLEINYHWSPQSIRLVQISHRVSTDGADSVAVSKEFLLLQDATSAFKGLSILAENLFYVRILVDYLEPKEKGQTVVNEVSFTQFCRL